MKRWLGVGLIGLVCLCFACAGMDKPKSQSVVFMASTIGPIDSGIVDVL